MRIEVLTPDLARKYRHEIAQFYYDNLHECVCMEHFTYEDAFEKIGDFIGHLENHEAVSYGVFKKDELCGYVWAYPHKFREENRMYVNEIRIRDDCRGGGYGKELLKRVEETAKEMGISALYLHAEADNLEAIKKYRSFGYAEERIQFRKALL